MLSAWYFELLKYFANRDYCFNDFWIRVFLTFLPLDACYFRHYDVDGETIVLKLIYHSLFKFFSQVRPTSLHNKSDLSFVSFIARVYFSFESEMSFLSPQQCCVTSRKEILASNLRNLSKNKIKANVSSLNPATSYMWW